MKLRLKEEDFVMGLVGVLVIFLIYQLPKLFRQGFLIEPIFSSTSINWKCWNKDSAERKVGHSSRFIGKSSG